MTGPRVLLSLHAAFAVCRCTVHLLAATSFSRQDRVRAKMSRWKTPQCSARRRLLACSVWPSAPGRTGVPQPRRPLPRHLPRSLRSPRSGNMEERRRFLERQGPAAVHMAQPRPGRTVLRRHGPGRTRPGAGGGMAAGTGQHRQGQLGGMGRRRPEAMKGVREARFRSAGFTFPYRTACGFACPAMGSETAAHRPYLLSVVLLPFGTEDCLRLERPGLEAGRTVDDLADRP